MTKTTKDPYKDVDPYKDSAYDSSGMPLGAETVDCDNQKEVAKHMVKDKYEEPPNINALEYDESVTLQKWQKRTEFNPGLQNTAIEVVGHKFPTKKEHLGIGGPEANLTTKDLGRPDEEKEHKPVEHHTPKDTVVTAKSVKSEDKKDEDDDKFKKALKDA